MQRQLERQRQAQQGREEVKATDSLGVGSDLDLGEGAGQQLGQGLLGVELDRRPQLDQVGREAAELERVTHALFA